MTYASGGLIQASDFNGFNGSVMQLWGTGTGSYGYGQTPVLANVTAVTSGVAASDWATMISRMSTMKQHQTNGTTTGVPSQPTSGGIVTYLSQVSTSIADLQTNRTALGAYGTSLSASYTTTTPWTNYVIANATISFANADAARYFFNAGGQLQINRTGTALSGNSKSSNWNTFLTSTLGTFYLAALTNGVTATGNTTPTTNTALGYYGSSSSEQLMFKDFDSPSTADYTANYMNVTVQTDGVTGSNGGTGSKIYLKCYLVDAAADTVGTNPANPYGDTVSGTTQINFYVYPPYTTYLANTWGTYTLTVAGSVS
jgi:hypothetical protein